MKVIIKIIVMVIVIIIMTLIMVAIILLIIIMKASITIMIDIQETYHSVVFTIDEVIYGCKSNRNAVCIFCAINFHIFKCICIFKLRGIFPNAFSF